MIRVDAAGAMFIGQLFSALLLYLVTGISEDHLITVVITH